MSTARKIDQSKVEALMDLLDEYGIEFRTEHNQMTEKTISICCPFCTDASFHLGIFKEGFNYHCFRCGENGTFRGLCLELGIPLKEAAKLYDKRRKTRHVKDDNLVKTVEDLICGVDVKCPYREISLPEESEPIEDLTKSTGVVFMKLPFFTFLRDRDLRISTLSSYNVRFCEFGEYAMRLILPVTFSNVVVGFQARSVVPHVTNKYVSSKGFRSSDFLFGFDEVALSGKREVYLVEGIFDAMRIGTGAMATFGKCLSKNQLALLRGTNFCRVVIGWDSDAFCESLKAASLLAEMFEVKVLSLPEGEDPDSLGRDKFMELVESTPLFDGGLK